MKKGNRIVFLGFVVLMALALVLSGCAQTNGSTADTTEEASAPAEEQATSEAPAAEETASDAASADAGSEKISVAHIMIQGNQPVQQILGQHFEKFAQEAGYDVTVLDGKGDAAGIANAADDLIAKGVTGFSVQPQDGASIDSVVRSAHDAGIPVVTLMNKPETETCPYILLDEKDMAFELGAYAAQKWLEFYPDSHIVLGVLDEPMSQYVHEVRSQSFVDGVLSVQDDAEVYWYAANGVRDDGYTVTEDMLQAHPDVNIIYGTNGDASMGSFSALRAAGRGTAVDGVPETELFVSVDGTESELIELADPTSSLKLCMAITPRAMMELVFNTLVDTINGEYAMDEDAEVVVNDKILDYYTMTVQDFEDFAAAEYLLDIDLEAKIAERQ